MKSILLTSIFLLFGCASTLNPIDRVVLPKSEREFILYSFEGLRFNNNPTIKSAFLDGKVCWGMSMVLVFNLYGGPSFEYHEKKLPTMINLDNPYKLVESRDIRWDFNDEKEEILGSLFFSDSLLIKATGVFSTNNPYYH